MARIGNLGGASEVVQSGEFALTLTAASGYQAFSIPINPVDTGSHVAEISQAGRQYSSAAIYGLFFLNSDNIEGLVLKDNTSGGTYYIRWRVIRLTPRAPIQRGKTTLAIGWPEADHNILVSPVVDYLRAWPRLSAFGMQSLYHNPPDSNYYVYGLRLAMTGPTTLAVRAEARPYGDGSFPVYWELVP